MPDWIVQTPVSTVRPTPPKAPAASGGGSPHYIRVTGSSSAYTAPTFTEDFSQGSASLVANQIELGADGVWQISMLLNVQVTTGTPSATGACRLAAPGGLRLSAAFAVYNDDSSDGLSGSGSMLFTVTTGDTVSFDEIEFSSSGLSPTWSLTVAAFWVGP
jgi:hypothetical protein